MKAVLKYKYIFLALLTILLGCKSKVYKTNNLNTTYQVNYLLKKDYEALSETLNQQRYANISTNALDSLFFEGISESVLFLDDLIKDNKEKTYKKLIKKITNFNSENHELHPTGFENNKAYLNLGTSQNYSFNYEVFADFRGKWYGRWKDDEVNQHWLSPQHMNYEIKIKDKKIKLKSFQTVSIGDGIGWNYNIEFDNKSYIIGYTCHLDDNGSIYLKRPHVGVNQKNKSSIWLTKDHIYLEFICKSENCLDLPLHYVITGTSFNNKSTNPTELNAFQTIYTVDPDVRLNFNSFSLQ